MRVLHVAASLSSEWGGPAAVVSNLAGSLHSKGVTCAIFAAGGAGGEVLKPDGVETRLFPVNPLGTVWAGFAPALARGLAGKVADCDLVHVHEIWHYPAYAALKAAKRASVPYVVTVHGNLTPTAMRLKKRLYIAWWLRRMLEGAAVLHALSEEEERQIRANGLSPPVAVVSNGNNPQAFEELPSRAEFEEKYPQIQGTAVILYLGRLHPKKGLDLLVRAFGRAPLAGSRTSLVIAGPDENGYMATLQTAANIEGVSSQLLFTGAVTGREKLAALGAADIFVLPSSYEGSSISTLEAMGSGLPVVISRQCNFPEVQTSKSGVVIDTDAQELAEALSYMVDNPEERRAMGERGRRLVRQNYTWDSIADRFIEIYETVVDAGMKRTPE